MFPWGDFILYLIANGAPPGPNTILSMTNGGHLGLRRTLPFLGGIWLGFSIVAMGCALLCTTLARILPNSQPVILVLSAIYMLYLAWKLFRSDGVLKLGRSGSSFQAGALLQFVNIKAYAYCIASIQVYILPFYGTQPIKFFGMSYILVIVAVLINFCWAAFGAAFRPLYEKYGRLINRIMSLVMVLCVLRLFL